MRTWIVGFALIAGCSPNPGAFTCERDEQCRLETVMGTCEPNGFCAFPDAMCKTGERYDDSAGSGVGGECVACPDEMYVHDGAPELCDGIDNDCDKTTVETCPTGCTIVHRPAPDDAHVYLFCTTQQTWGMASTTCASQGYRLARADDQSESAFLFSTRNTTIPNMVVWIGGSDKTTEGMWIWEDGAQFWQGGSGGMAVGGLFEAWGSGQPDNGGTGNEDCLSMRGTDWNDLECSNANAFICERY